jgi:hypothetical protein
MENQNNSDKLISRIEKISGDIQLLALNIAVAAAKITHRKTLDMEINDSLSRLVSRASDAVRKMNKLIDAAKVDSVPEYKGNDFSSSSNHAVISNELETLMNSIIQDSEKVVSLLDNVRGSE